MFDVKFHFVPAFMKADIFSNVRYVNTSAVRTRSVLIGIPQLGRSVREPGTSRKAAGQ